MTCAINHHYISHTQIGTDDDVAAPQYINLSIEHGAQHRTFLFTQREADRMRERGRERESESEKDRERDGGEEKFLFLLLFLFLFIFLLLLLEGNAPRSGRRTAVFEVCSPRLACMCIYIYIYMYAVYIYLYIYVPK